MTARANGELIASLTLDVGASGCWIAQVNLDHEVELPTTRNGVTIEIEGQSYVGTVDPTGSGTFVLATRATVIGGLGWRKSIQAISLHSDAGLKASSIAKAAASAAGETLLIAPSSDYQLQGVDYARAAGPASRVLAALFPEWYVAPTGVTYVSRGEGATRRPEILAYDPTTGVLTCPLDPLFAPGDYIESVKLHGTLRVRALLFDLRATSERVHLWTEVV